MLALVAFLINRSVIMLIDCGIRAHKLDFELLAEHLLGPKGYYLAVGSMLMFAYGGSLAYLVILGDTLPKVCDLIFGNSFLSARRPAILFFATLVVLPLCLLRDLSSLAWTSFFSIFADVVLIIIILVAATSASKDQDEHFESVDLGEMGMAIFAGIGTMSFAFVCQHNSFLVFRSLKTPTLSQWRKVADISLIVAYLLCLILGLIGFFAFYPYVEGDLLNNFPADSSAVAAARLLLAITMLFTYPMECYVARHCIHSLTRRYASKQVLSSKASRKVLSESRRRSSDNVMQDVTSEDFWQRRIGGDASEDDIEDDDVGGGRQGWWRGWWRSRKPTHAAGATQIVLSPLQAYGQIAQRDTNASHAHDNNDTNRAPMPATHRVPSLSLMRDHLQSREDLFEDVALDQSAHRSASQPNSNSVAESMVAQWASRVTAFVHPSPMSSIGSKAPSAVEDGSSNNPVQSRRRRDYSGILTRDPPTNPMAVSLSASPQVDEVNLTLTDISRPSIVDEEINDESILIDVDRDVPAADIINTSEHVVVTLALWASTVAIALIVDKLGLVSSLTGVAAASSLGYMLPAAIYLKTHAHERAAMGWPAAVRKYGVAAFMGAFGIASFFIGIVTIFTVE